MSDIHEEPTIVPEPHVDTTAAATPPDTIALPVPSVDAKQAVIDAAIVAVRCWKANPIGGYGVAADVAGMKLVEAVDALLGAHVTERGNQTPP